jgi:hypothetical protein
VVLPTTNAGGSPIHFDLSDLRPKGKLISNHILMNTSGSLLLRRNQHLRANQNAHHFLQHLMATGKGKCVPLLYPEGTVFPNQFWLSESDGSTTGAIPSIML